MEVGTSSHHITSVLSNTEQPQPVLVSENLYHNKSFTQHISRTYEIKFRNVCLLILRVSTVYSSYENDSPKNDKSGVVVVVPPKRSSECLPFK